MPIANLYKGRSMTEKKPFRVATPPSQGAMEPIRLETARWYKKLREEHPAILGRVHQFMAGDILVATVVHRGRCRDRRRSAPARSGPDQPRIWEVRIPLERTVPPP